MEHICDRHNECYHLPLGLEERPKKWFQPGITELTVHNKCYIHICIYSLTQVLKHVKSYTI